MENCSKVTLFGGSNFLNAGRSKTAPYLQRAAGSRSFTRFYKGGRRIFGDRPRQAQGLFTLLHLFLRVFRKDILNSTRNLPGLLQPSQNYPTNSAQAS